MTVGGYSEYTRPLIDHLVNHKIQHWDRLFQLLFIKKSPVPCTIFRQLLYIIISFSSLRELVSRALHNLTFLDPSYVAINS